MADVACIGVRGVQQIRDRGARRVRSSSRVAGRTQKASWAKIQPGRFDKQVMETQMLLQSFLDLSGPLANNHFGDQSVVQKPEHSNPRRFFGKEIHLYEEFYIVAGSDEQFDDEPLDCKELQGLPGRHFFGREVHSYEEFYILAGSDGHFDDEPLDHKELQGLPARHFFGREIHFYEDLYCLVGEESGLFDDEHLQAGTRSRYFYGKEIMSYEELYILAGNDAEFDDERA
jgi:hypothetical protein